MPADSLLRGSRLFIRLRLSFLLLAGFGGWLVSAAQAQVVTAWGSNGYGQTTVPAGLSGVTAIAAGESHSLALKSDGTVVAWGANYYGQSTVPAGLTGVVAISAGFRHSLALRSDGTVAAWGDSFFRQTWVPSGLSGAVAIAAGTWHSLALKDDGTVVAWGSNVEGTPLDIPAGLTGVTAIAAGNGSSIALKSDGRVVVWGWNYLNGGTLPPGLTSVADIASVWHHSLALKSNGTVLAWGENTYGQTTVPAGLTGVVGIAAGYSHSMALKSDGTLVTWGKNTTGESTVPAGLGGVAAIAAGGSHSLALSAPAGGTAPVIVSPAFARTEAAGTMGSGLQFFYRIMATGSPTSFQASGLPTGLSVNTATGVINGVATQTGTFPVTLSATNATGTGTRQLTVIVSGAPHFLSLPPLIWPAGIPVTYQVPAHHIPTSWTATGLPPGLSINAATGVITGTHGEPGAYSVTLGISNAYGSDQAVQTIEMTPVVEWGRNDLGQSTVPAGLGSVVSIAAGGNHSLALKSNGTVVAWGHNHDGQLDVPAGLSNVMAVAAGETYSLALKIDGTVVAWGERWFGQTSVPAGLNGVVAIAAANRYSLALKSNGTVVAWGQSAAPPAKLTGVGAISAGAYHSLALKSDGTIVGWGFDGPRTPAGLSGVMAIAAGAPNSLALKRDGTVVAWGSDGSYVDTVPAGLSGVVAIDVGGLHSLALKSDGTVVSWGGNSYGESTVPSGLTGVVAIAAGSGFSMVLSAPGDDTPPVVVSPAFAVTDAAGTAGSGLQFHYPIAATGSPVSFSATGLPAGLSLDANSGIISGVATMAGTFAVIVSATNAAGTGSRQLMLTVRGVPEFLSVPPALLSAGISQTLPPHAIVGGPPGAWTAIGLPPGLSIDAGTGLISGIPTHPGIYNVTLGFSNAYGSAHAEWQVEISPVIAWGSATNGQTTLPRGLSAAKAIAAGGSHAMALLTDGTVVAWGNNSYGQAAVTGLSDVSALAAGYAHSLGLLTDGSVIAWGRNASGQSTVPATLSNVSSISAGDYFSMALKIDGTVVAWGANDWGQSTVPAGLSGVTAIAAGGLHALALRTNGTVVTWGNNSYGQTSVPPGLSGVVAIAASPYHSLALRSDGSVVGWGSAETVPAGLTDVVAIAAGGPHSIALKGEGTVVTWGAANSVPAGLRGVSAVDAAGGSGAEAYYLALVAVPPVLLSASSITAHADTAFSYQITASGSPASFAAAGLPSGLSLNPSTGLITGTPTQSGLYTVGLTLYGQAAGTAQIFISVQPNAVTAQSAYTAWRDAQWPGGGLAIAPVQDPDEDGRLNVMEFAMGSDPNQPNPATAPQFSRNAAGRLELQIDVPASAAAALLIKAQFSSDLLFGTGTLEAGGTPQPNPPAGTVRLKFADPVAEPAGVRRLGRLHVMLPSLQ